MNKFFQIIGFLTLILFTLFYSNQITTVMKENDDLLKQIEEIQSQYKTEPINAIIENNTIIAGISGVEIDVKESYKKMKKVNSFNDNLLVYKKVKPNISVLDYFDKYIIKGNKKAVSFLFLIEQNCQIEELLKILNKYQIKSTLYTDGNWFENNNEQIIKLIDEGHTIGNLGYNYDYSVNGINWMNTIVTKIGNQKYTYCYVEEENNKILDICSKYNSYTIKPNIVVKTNPFITIRQNLEEGSIISLKVNNNTLTELSLIIEYIFSKGLNIVNLEELLDE